MARRIEPRSKVMIKAPHARRRAPGGRRRRSLEEAVRDRVVMITGASSGIGRATALRVGAAGGAVLLVARTQETLDQTHAQIAEAGGVAHVHRCDLSDLDDVDRMAAEVLDRHGRVDLLVNSAGRSIRRSIADSYDRMHDFQRTMQLNYFGTVKLILGLLPGMRERKWGHIINISSIGVQLPGPRFSAYIASKAALDAFSACIAAEVRDDNVRVTTIYMPLVRTPMVPGAASSKWAISPDDAAAIVAEAVVTRRERMTTRLGSIGQVAGALNPGAVAAVNAVNRLLRRAKAVGRG